MKKDFYNAAFLFTEVYIKQTVSNFRSVPNKGLAFLPGQCVAQNCAIATGQSFYSSYLPAHELGHT